MRNGAWAAADANCVGANADVHRVELTVGNTRSSVAYDINASGQVVGQAAVDSRATRAVLWADGSLTALGSLNGSFHAAQGPSSSR